MSAINIVNTAVVIIGVPSIICGCIFLGRKLQILDTMSGCIEKIKINLSVISNYLTKNHHKFNPSELQTLSPFQLTEEGKNFIKNIGFDKVFNQNRTEFFNFISSEDVRLKYDVENAAIKSIYALYDKPFMEFLKVYFYNHPERYMDNTAPTLGVYVRDKYLEEHPEITQ